MTVLDDFESTAGGAIWEPKQTGKGENLKALTPGDDSYVIGWYLGAKHGVGDNNSTLHTLKIMQVGNEDHIIGDVPDTGKVGIWGTGVLDSNIVDENIQIGQCIAIQWKGKQKPKSGSGKPYHTWDLRVPKDTSKYPPLSMAEIGSIPEPTTTSEVPVAPKEEKAVPASQALDMGDDEDDLPF